MTAALELSGVSKTFDRRGSGRVAALDAVSLEVPAGALFGLLGPNGAGKTTLLSIAAGFLRADAGSVRRRGRLSWLPQDAAFQPDVPLRRQLELFARLSGLAAHEARGEVARVLGVVRLGDAAARLPRDLSHGMRKRAALGQALLGEPELVFLDEPTAGLDPENARHVRELVRALRGRCTLVLCSHNLHEIQELCDHVAVLFEGRVAECGPLDELTAASRLLRISFLAPRAARAAEVLASLAAVARVEVTGERDLDVHLASAAGDDRDPALRAILARLLECDLIPQRVLPGASLEARFLELTAGR